jgi:hypothetical protein
MITTYLTDNDLSRRVTHKSVAKVLTELQALHPSDGWHITEYIYPAYRRWYWPFTEVAEARVFELYKRLTDYGEYQIINFYRDGTDWSINTFVPAELVIAFMYGAMRGR